MASRLTRISIVMASLWSCLWLHCLEAQEAPPDWAAKVDQAIQALASSDPAQQQWAAGVLVLAGAKAKPAIPAVIETLNREWRKLGDDLPKERHDLLFVLEAAGPGAADALPLLMELGKSSNFHIKYKAARVLGAMGPAARPAVPLLIKMASDEYTSVRRRALEALGNLGPEVAPDAFETLVAAMKDPTHPVREQAVLAMGKFREVGQSALPALTETMLNERSPERWQAALSIWRLTQDAELVLPALRSMLANSNMEWDPAVVLGEMGPAAAPAVPELIRALEKDESAQIPAAEALGKIGPAAKDALPALRKLLDHPVEIVRQTAQRAIDAIEASK
jgi:HEAT repeat protein